MTEHATTWHIDTGETRHGAHYVLDERNRMIARCAKSNSAIADEEDRAHAADIVRCVNAHEGSIEAINLAIGYIGSRGNETIERDEILAKLRAAITQSEATG